MISTHTPKAPVHRQAPETGPLGFLAQCIVFVLGTMMVVSGTSACGGRAVSVDRLQLRATPSPINIHSIDIKLLLSHSLPSSPQPTWFPKLNKVAFIDNHGESVKVFDTHSLRIEEIFTTDNHPSAASFQYYYATGLAFASDNELYIPASRGVTSGDELLVFNFAKSLIKTIAFEGNPVDFSARNDAFLATKYVGNAIISHQGVEHKTYEFQCNPQWSVDEAGFFSLTREGDSCRSGNHNLIYISSPQSNTKEEFILEDVIDYTLNPNGSGVAYLRQPSEKAYYYEPLQNYYSLYYLDFTTRENLALAEAASFPQFLGKTNLIVFNSPDGLVLSDFNKHRVIGTELLEIAVSNDGRFLAGSSRRYSVEGEIAYDFRVFNLSLLDSD